MLAVGKYREWSFDPAAQPFARELTVMSQVRAIAFSPDGTLSPQPGKSGAFGEVKIWKIADRSESNDSRPPGQHLCDRLQS
jgi:hypothetical protein